MAIPSITTNFRHMLHRDKRQGWREIGQAIIGKSKSLISITLYLRWSWEWAFPGLWWVLHSGAAVPRRLRAPIFLMREPSRLDIVGSGSSLQPMLFSPQRNKPSYSLIPLWHPWPNSLQSHPPTATTLYFLSTTYPQLCLFVLFLSISLYFLFSLMWLYLLLWAWRRAYGRFIMNTVLLIRVCHTQKNKT